MTPMIDVVFLLLVFFVCASIGQTPDLLLPAQLQSGQTTSEVDVQPENPPEWQAPEVRIRLQANPDDGRLLIQLNERPLPQYQDLQHGLTQLAQIDRTAPVVLDIGDQVSVQQFISVYDLCQSLAFESISFAVRQ
jgi:biopolymer transport protein ExbD